MTFIADSVQLEVLYMAKMGTGLFDMAGQIIFDRCEQVMLLTYYILSYMEKIIPIKNTTGFNAFTFLGTKFESSDDTTARLILDSAEV